MTAHIHAVHARHLKIRKDNVKRVRRQGERPHGIVPGFETENFGIAYKGQKPCSGVQGLQIVIHDHPACARFLLCHTATLPKTTLREREDRKPLKTIAPPWLQPWLPERNARQ